MLRISLTSALCAFSFNAYAHVGHIAPSSGHAHYLAVGAAIVALAIGVGAFAKIKRSNNV